MSEITANLPGKLGNPDAALATDSRTVHGTPHAGDQALPDILPETYQDSRRAICGFATSLSGQ